MTPLSLTINGKTFTRQDTNGVSCWVSDGLITQEDKKQLEAALRVLGYSGADNYLGQDTFVFYGEIREAKFKRGLRLSDGSVTFNLTAKQALSFLAWLQQEEATLQQLAKEQEQADDQQ